MGNILNYDRSRDEPEIIERFRRVLENAGFVLREERGPDPRAFGNRLLIYAKGPIGIQLALDRGEWLVWAGEMVPLTKWYLAEVLQDLYRGSSGTRFLLSDEICFLENNLQNLETWCAPENRAHTHEVLGRLGRLRVIALFGPSAQNEA